MENEPEGYQPDNLIGDLRNELPGSTTGNLRG
jgi:hypothetical protein